MAQIQGTSGSDNIGGTADPDVIHAGAGDDFVNAMAGDDEVYGEEGNDTLMGGQDNDHLFGGDGNDVLLGGLGSDSIDGGDGDDRIIASSDAGQVHGGAGDDDIGANALAGQIIDGGDGIDLLRFSAQYSAGVTIDLTDPSTVQTVGGTSIVNVERMSFVGSDALTGAADHATGGALDDTLAGLSGDDVLNGGGGNDAISGGIGADQINGGDGDDVITWSDGDTVDGGAGIDLIKIASPFGAGGTLDFSDPDAVQTFGSGSITHVERIEFYGDTGSGSAHITGGAYADKLSGYGGDDIFAGGDGDDELYGQGGVDRLEGGGGDDLIVDGTGNPTSQVGFSFIDGGSGFDTLELDYGQFSGALSLDIEANDGAVLNIERLLFFGGNGTGTSTFKGGEADDIIFSGYGNDLIDGRGGNDDLRGGGGVDIINGGDGDDLIYGGGGVGDTGGADTLSGGEGNDFIHADEQVGGSLDGGAGDDQLIGGAGNDSMTGGSGNDWLIGGGGTDSMTGGAGDDLYDVDNMGDVVTELAGEGVDTVTTALGTAAAIYTLPDNVENFTGKSFAGQTVAGNALDNSLLLLKGNDVVDLSAGGNDTVNAGPGNDYIYFGAAFTAADQVIGGTGTDSVGLRGNYDLTLGAGTLFGVENFNLLSGSTLGGTERFSYSITTVDANVPAGGRLTVYAGGLLADESLFFNGYAETNGALSVYGGAGNDTFAGGPANDAFVGGAGDDTMYGLGGMDWLEGGLGADTMRGGPGNDVFVYQSAAESTATKTDHIVDFEYVSDHIVLTNVDANADLAGDQAFTFIGDAAFSNTAGELRAYQSGASWFVEGDVNGDGNADLVIQVDPVAGHALIASDFLL